MGKPYKRTGPPAAVLQQVSSSPQTAPLEEESPPQQHSVDLGDTSAIKRTLDDVAVQEVLSSGHKENFTVSNIKIGLGLFTCCWALLAQFYPKKYPHNWHILVLCLVCYLICTALLNAVAWCIERDTFLFTSRSQGQSQGSILSLSSSMPKYQDMYTLSLQSRNMLSDTPRTVAQLEKSVTAYFDTAGSLLEEVYRHDVQQALRQYRAGGKKAS